MFGWAQCFFLFFLYSGAVLGAGADLSFLETAISWDTKNNERPLSGKEKNFLDHSLSGELKSAMKRSAEIYRDQRAQEDDVTALLPNCFWWSLAWHLKELREMPRPVEFMIEASFIGETSHMPVDLASFQASDWMWNDNRYYGIAETLRLNPVWLEEGFEKVREGEAKAGDIFFVFNEQRGFNNFPVDYEEFLATKFENLPFRFFLEARHVVHSALYIGEGFVFQKDAIVTDSFRLMTVADAKIYWQETYGKGWGLGDEKIDVSAFEVKLLRPMPSFLSKLRKILETQIPGSALKK